MKEGFDPTGCDHEPELASNRLRGMIERKVPAWMQVTKPRRKAVTTTHEPLSEWRSTKYVVQFIGCMTFWGFIGLLSSSSFPIGVGLFFFFTDDAFIEWVLQKIGIRFVPDTFGPEFIKALVFLFGVWVLLAHWKDSVPKWLSAWLPPDGAWSAVALAALTCAVLKTTSAAVIRKLLPKFGIEIAPGRQDLAILGLMGVGVALLTFVPMLAAWSGGH